MKKLIFVIMAGTVMTACGNRCGSECANDSIVADSADTIVAVDSAVVDTLINE